MKINMMGVPMGLVPVFLLVAGSLVAAPITMKLEGSSTAALLADNVNYIVQLSGILTVSGGLLPGGPVIGTGQFNGIGSGFIGGDYITGRFVVDSGTGDVLTGIMYLPEILFLPTAWVTQPNARSEMVWTGGSGAFAGFSYGGVRFSGQAFPVAPGNILLGGLGNSDSAPEPASLLTSSAGLAALMLFWARTSHRDNLRRCAGSTSLRRRVTIPASFLRS